MWKGDRLLQSLSVLLFSLAAAFPVLPPLGARTVIRNHQERNHFVGSKLSHPKQNEAVDVAAERFNARWNAMFERLVEYKEEHGDCLVPRRFAEDPALGSWVMSQRRESILDGRMKQERRDRLNSIGFVWSVRPFLGSKFLDKKWNNKYEELVSFQREHGHCRVSMTHSGGSLGSWVLHQRKREAGGKLCADRRARLESIGFVWVAGGSLSQNEREWKEMFARLAAYKLKYGDCLVPQEWKDDRKLGSWVAKQRSLMMDGAMYDERREKLDSVGFVWNVLYEQWEEMFAKLQAYKLEHGDCLVPYRCKDDLTLGHWVWDQRSPMMDGVMYDERREKLDSVGFVWNVHDDQWEEMFARLQAYKLKHGDCLVPREWKDDRKLGHWVMSQRGRMMDGVMYNERREKLDSVGFVWNVLDAQWEEMFARLQAYKLKHGDCQVPRCCKEDPKLAQWVANQRQRNKVGKVSDDRQNKLDSIGFVWKVR